VNKSVNNSSDSPVNNPVNNSKIMGWLKLRLSDFPALTFLFLGKSERQTLPHPTPYGGSRVGGKVSWSQTVGKCEVSGGKVSELCAEDCRMCSGECCNLCGAGCWSSETNCQHDVIDRHKVWHGNTRQVASVPSSEESDWHTNSPRRVIVPTRNQSASVLFILLCINNLQLINNRSVRKWLIINLGKSCPRKNMPKESFAGSCDCG
jgi:hypothetical protein